MSRPLAARRFRIEIGRCLKGCHPAVYVQPVEYIGKEEFRRLFRELSKSYMDLIWRRPWRWSRVFWNDDEAASFAIGIARFLGESVFVDGKGSTCVVMPEGEAEVRGEKA